MVIFNELHKLIYQQLEHKKKRNLIALIINLDIKS